MANAPLQRAVSIVEAKRVDPDLSDLATLFAALAHTHRLWILNYVGVGEAITVTDISQDLGISQSRASYHVKQLVDAGLIHGERGEGNFIWYWLEDGAFERLAELFERS